MSFGSREMSIQFTQNLVRNHTTGKIVRNCILVSILKKECLFTLVGLRLIVLRFASALYLHSCVVMCKKSVMSYHNLLLVIEAELVVVNEK